MAKVSFNLEELAGRIEEAAKEAAKDWLENTVKPTADDLCPFESGALVGTGTVEETEDGATISYGEGLDYAEKQYYDASLNHPNGKVDHWIEAASDQHQSELAEIVANKIKEVLE